MLKLDKVRSAYAAVGRLDALLNVPQEENTVNQLPEPIRVSGRMVGEQNLTMARKKTMFLSRLELTQTTQRHREGEKIILTIVVFFISVNPQVDSNLSTKRVLFFLEETGVNFNTGGPERRPSNNNDWCAVVLLFWNIRT